MNIKQKIKLFSFRKFVLAVADMFIIGTAALLSNYILSLFRCQQVHTSTLTLQTCVMVMTGFFALWMCGAYAKMWRYFKAKDYISCF